MIREEKIIKTIQSDEKTVERLKIIKKKNNFTTINDAIKLLLKNYKSKKE